MVKKMIFLGVILCSILIMPIANAQQFEKMAFQESATIIYDQRLSNSIIVSIGLETIDNKEIKFSDELLEKINSNENIRSIVFTNTGECVIGVTTEQQCIMINFSYEDLKGDGGIKMVQDSAKNMGDELIDDLNDAYRTNATFHSIFVHTVNDTNLLLETSGVISGRGTVSATYVTDKQATDYLFTDLSGVLFPREIREGGGFYEISKKLAKQDNSNISISIIPSKDENFFIFKVTQEIKDVEIDVERIDFLELFDIEEITRSDYFDGKIVPLNSVIHLIILTEEDKQVKALSANVITDLTKLENVLKKGWFISSPAGKMIDLRFLFGDSKTIMADELIVKTTPMDTNSEMTNYSVEDVVDKPEDSTQYIVLGIIIIVGIGAAIFYLKGYKPKH